jgi:hypothetical protein
VNGLIPALLCVLLAEIGAPLGALATRRGNLVAFGIAALVFAAAGIGWQFSTMMASDARTLMLGVLMVFAAGGQFWAGKPPKDNLFGSIMAITRSPAPGLAFGFAAYLGEPVTPALGALFAVGVAAGAAALGVAVPTTARRAAGGVLLVTGLAAALRAFHLL